jgi:hypothetical protein
MAIDAPLEFPTVFATTESEPPLQGGSTCAVAKMKERQARKIRELGDALATAGFLTLDEQAKVLRLCRSTTWTVLKSNHKGSGLSATIINRILAAPQIPPLVRAKVLEYVEEKSSGLYGHGKTQRRRFTARLSIKRRTYVGEIVRLQPESRIADNSVAADREQETSRRSIP